jgi:hypothetical protein
VTQPAGTATGETIVDGMKTVAGVKAPIGVWNYEAGENDGTNVTSALLKTLRHY